MRRYVSNEVYRISKDMAKQVGKENPYVPKYIKDVPLFQEGSGLNSDDYLSHHRNEGSKELNSEPKIGKGIKDDFISVMTEAKVGKRGKKSKRRCLTCGGDDHDTKDCFGKSKKRDEISINKRNEDVDYDGKRDRWYGYDANDYTKYLKDWDDKQKKKQDAKENEEGDNGFDTDEEIELKELGLDYKDIGIDVKQEGEKIIRLREDQAVYLKDVKNETITYDPKSRTNRDSQTGYFNEDDLFVKHLTGEAIEYSKKQKLAWEGDKDKRGVEVHNDVSNPTLASMKKTNTQDHVKQKLLAKYGNSDEIDDEEDDTIRSKYLEDVYINNHTSVWGSYYQDGQWGYSCCLEKDKNSLCSKI